MTPEIAMVARWWTNLCKLKEGSRISSKVFNVKHGLRIWKIREVHSKPCINAITRAKVWNSTRHRHLEERSKS